MSLDGKLVWSVNPGDDSVSVIRTDQNKVVKKIKVGDEPESVALDPAGRYAYVANAASANLTVIRIINASPEEVQREAGHPLRTGREHHHGLRAVRRGGLAGRPPGVRGQQRPGHDHGARRRGRASWWATSTCARASATRRTRPRTFQPRGMAVTKNSKRLFVTALPLVHASPAACRPTTTAARAPSAASTSRPRRARSPTTSRRSSCQDRARGHRLHDRLDRRRRGRPDLGLPEPAPEHRDQGQQRLPAEHRRLAQRAAAVQRGHAGVRERHRRRQRRAPRATRARPSSSTSTWAPATPSRARRSSSSPTPGPSASRATTPTPSPPAATCWSRRASTGRASSTSRSTPTRRATST